MRLETMEIYQDIGKIFTREELAEEINTENLNNLMRNIEIQIVELIPEDIDNFPWR